MQNIGDFLKRYLNFTPPALIRSRAVSRVLFEKFGVECGDDVVVIRGDTAFIRVEGMLKSEITLHKKEILARIAEVGGGTLADLR